MADHIYSTQAEVALAKHKTYHKSVKYRPQKFPTAAAFSILVFTLLLAGVFGLTQMIYSGDIRWFSLGAAGILSAVAAWWRMWVYDNTQMNSLEEEYDPQIVVNEGPIHVNARSAPNSIQLAEFPAQQMRGLVAMVAAGCHKISGANLREYRAVDSKDSKDVRLIKDKLKRLGWGEDAARGAVDLTPLGIEELSKE